MYQYQDSAPVVPGRSPFFSCCLSQKLAFLSIPVPCETRDTAAAQALSSPSLPGTGALFGFSSCQVGASSSRSPLPDVLLTRSEYPQSLQEKSQPADQGTRLGRQLRHRVLVTRASLGRAVAAGRGEMGQGRHCPPTTLGKGAAQVHGQWWGGNLGWVLETAVSVRLSFSDSGSVPMTQTRSLPEKKIREAILRVCYLQSKMAKLDITRHHPGNLREC